MAVFTAPFLAVAHAAAADLWELTAPSTSRLAIFEIRFGQDTEEGDAAAESLQVSFRRGDTSPGSGGGTITPVNYSGHTGAPTSGTTVERNNTTQASGGTVVLADAWNIQAPFLWLPPDPKQRFIIEASGVFVVAVTAPADSITASGTITWEEIGLVAP
jgi:hypothetical protein